MKQMLTLLMVAALLLAAGQTFASEVTNVELSYAEGSTMALINVDGGVRFTHQTEEAKDGKPFRVIVDILSAAHKLGANNFSSLPNCPVRAIRTSQYSVKPEAVVRIVFDMGAEQVYRVESNDKTITLRFADKAKRSFAPWSTASVVAAKKATKAKPAKKQAEPAKVASAPAKPKAKSAAELNKSIDKDRLASLEPKAAKSTKPVAKAPKKTKKATKASTPKLSQSEAHYGPFADASLKEDKKAAAKPAAKKSPAPAAKAKSKTTVAAKTEKPKPVAKAEPKKAAVKKAPAQTKAKKTELAKAKPKQTKKQAATVASKPAPASKTKTKSATSRFRREPVTSKKIKGTLVAEFPKRLVIKYKSKQHRDPFATLIDESKTNDDPVERQVPNVEGLKLVGVIEAGAKDNRALFEDSEGYGYILKTGDKVRKGYVLRVEADRVYFQIFEYGWSRTVALHIES